jgi:hypothetical protein
LIEDLVVCTKLDTGLLIPQSGVSADANTQMPEAGFPKDSLQFHGL